MEKKKASYLLIKLLYFFCISLVGVYCFKRPFYNWDMLPYTALILQTDQYSIKEAHDLAYQLTGENVPAENYRQLTDSSHVYRNRMLNNAQAFEKELPFYVVKPLYIGLCYLSYKAGISLPQSTLVPSFISYLLIGLLLFYWLSLYLRLPVTFLIALLIMVSPPLTEVAKTSSPDCLSALLLSGAFYFIIEKPSLQNAFILLVLSVFARLDNALTFFLILCIIFFSGKWYRKISVRLFIGLLGLLVLCYLLVGFFASQYGWSVFFYNDFANRLHPVYGMDGQFSVGNYFRLMYEHVLSGIRYSHLALFMAMLVLSLGKPVYSKELSFEQLFSLSIPLILFIRFILFPDISDRFYIPGHN